MFTYSVIAIIWALGAAAYLAVTVLAVPDFVPSHLIKINWMKALLWPLFLAWGALKGICNFVSKATNTAVSKKSPNQDSLNLHSPEVPVITASERNS